MAVKSSGAISIYADIVTEFGGDAPHSLSEYYGGAGRVPAGANPGVPTSGAIGLSNMYGTVAATVLTYTANVNNVNLATDVVAAGGDLNTPVIVTINSGVTIGSNTYNTAAMSTGTGWGSGTTINITNNGSLVGATGSGYTNYSGAGGNGGTGSNWSGSPGGGGGTGSADGNTGGSAFEHSQTADNNLSVIFDVQGTRTAGAGASGTTPGAGGGGGGGGGYANCCYPGGNGGGGGGVPGGSGTRNNGAGGLGGPGGYGAGIGGGSGNPGESGRHGGGPGGSGGGGGGTSPYSGSAGNVLSGNTSQIS